MVIIEHSQLAQERSFFWWRILSSSYVGR